MCVCQFRCEFVQYSNNVWWSVRVESCVVEMENAPETEIKSNSMGIVPFRHRIARAARPALLPAKCFEHKYDPCVWRSVFVCSNTVHVSFNWRFASRANPAGGTFAFLEHHLWTIYTSTYARGCFYHIRELSLPLNKIGWRFFFSRNHNCFTTKHVVFAGLQPRRRSAAQRRVDSLARCSFASCLHLTHGFVDRWAQFRGCSSRSLPNASGVWQRRLFWMAYAVQMGIWKITYLEEISDRMPLNWISIRIVFLGCSRIFSIPYKRKQFTFLEQLH